MEVAIRDDAVFMEGRNSWPKARNAVHPGSNHKTRLVHKGKRATPGCEIKSPFYDIFNDWVTFYASLLKLCGPCETPKGLLSGPSGNIGRSAGHRGNRSPPRCGKRADWFRSTFAQCD